MCPNYNGDKKNKNKEMNRFGDTFIYDYDI